MEDKRSCFRAGLVAALCGRPLAEARIEGSRDFPDISGVVRFYQTNSGTVVYTEVVGLPSDEGPCGGRVFGFHIHGGGSCEGSMEEEFAGAMSHYDVGSCGHPHHAGDMPPLFGNNGAAQSAFLTGRFLVKDVVGRTVIIHEHPDDFTTQPSGDSGARIACGEIRWVTGC